LNRSLIDGWETTNLRKNLADNYPWLSDNRSITSLNHAVTLLFLAVIPGGNLPFPVQNIQNVRQEHRKNAKKRAGNHRSNNLE
jgi:hypothetical protein